MRIGLLGVPTSLGSHHAGQENAPDAVRAAGLVESLTAAGHEVSDHGNLTRRPHQVAPKVDGVRAVDAVAAMLAEVVPAVTAIVAAGQVPFVVGGDCTITLGVLAGVAERRPHLVYIDGDADLSTPTDSESGILDAMGIAHLLGRGAPELAPVVRAAALSPADITLFGVNPTELDEPSRKLLGEAGVRLFEADEVTAGPERAARRALQPIPVTTPLLLHLDVDVLDSGSLPLANFPHFGGLQLNSLAASVRVLTRRPLAGFVLTEINPSHDPTGVSLSNLVRHVAAALEYP